MVYIIILAVLLVFMHEDSYSAVDNDWLDADWVQLDKGESR